ncbi:MAG: hypothetical protein HYU77_13435 [Betaproteobacteria bacterium]|nr:hypothetical protein [Betaproteobacteria bacterium]
MDSTIYSKTGKGVLEMNKKALPKDLAGVLVLVDGKSTVAEICGKPSKFSPDEIKKSLEKLEKDGYIRVFLAPAQPAAAAAAAAAPAKGAGDLELDFTASISKAELEAKAEAAARAKVEAERRAKVEAEAKGNAEAEARARAVQEGKAKAEAEAKAKSEAEARARAEAEARARAAAEARAKQEAEARTKAEAQLKAKLEAEAKARAEAEAKAKREAEARAKAEAEAKAKAEAEARVKAEAERKAREEAEARARAEAEMKAKLEAEAKAKAEAEARAKAEAEARARIESELRAKLEAETRAKLEAALKAQQEAEAKAKAEAEARAKAEAELRERAEREARAKIEAEQRAKAEEETRRKAEEEAHRKAEAEARLRAEAERKAQEEAEARRKAEEDAKRQAEEAARLREEAERRAREEAEARRRAEEEAKARAEAEKKAKEEAEARQKAEAEAKQRAEEEARAKAEAEQQANQEVAALAELEKKIMAEVERRIRAEMGLKAEPEPKAAPEKVAAKPEADLGAMADTFSKSLGEQESKTRQEEVLKALEGADADTTLGRRRRTAISSVLFMDIVGYSKQPVSVQIEIKEQFNRLVSDFIKEIPEADRIILDTGDGAAVSFLKDPEDALEVAIKMRDALRDERQKYARLAVRIGINLGPVQVVKDMNNQTNLVGDGINDAQRVMSFAGDQQIFVSRSYHDVVARISQDYARQFVYRGSHKDKHGRPHEVYEAGVTQAKPTPVAAAHPGAAPSKAEADFSSFDLSGLADLEGGAAPAAKAPPPRAEPVAAGPAAPSLDLSGLETEAKATVEEDERRKAEEDAKAKAAAEEAKRKADEEAKRKAEEETKRKAEEAEKAKVNAEAKAKLDEEMKTKAAEEARLFKEAEARAEVEAERRAKEEAEAKVRQAAEAQRRAEPPPARKKPVSWGKYIGIGVVVLIAGGIGFIEVMPMSGYIPGIERLAAERFHDTVKVGGAKASLFPPHLKLSQVAIGKRQELKIASIRIPDLFSIGGGKPIKSLELDGATLDHAAWANLANWLKPDAQAKLILGEVRLKNAKLVVGEVTVDKVDGTLAYGPDGTLQRGSLKTADGKLTAEITQKGEEFQIEFGARDWTSPFGAQVQFSDFSAKATAGAGGLAIGEMEGHYAGGSFSGRAELKWSPSWTLQGEIALKQVGLEAAAPTFTPEIFLSGKLDANLRFAAAADASDKLLAAPRIDATFTVEKGEIGNMDLARAIQSPSREGHRGGRTKFENELAGAVQAADNRFAFRNLKMTSGVFTATGNVDLSQTKELSGRINVDIGGRIRGTLGLSGSLKDPLLRAGG